MIADAGNYAHFQEALAWGPDHRTLHLSTRMYGGNRAHTVGYMQSPDFGKTWQRFDGTKIELPGTSETIDVIAQDRTKQDLGYRCGMIAVDPAGTPHVLYSQAKPHPPDVWIATPGKNGTWKKRSLMPDITKVLPGWFGAMPGGMTFGVRAGMKSSGSNHATAANTSTLQGSRSSMRRVRTGCRTSNAPPATTA
jgi:hypothetical protein